MHQLRLRHRPSSSSPAAPPPPPPLLLPPAPRPAHAIPPATPHARSRHAPARLPPPACAAAEAAPPPAIPDQRVSVKLSLASGSGKLDLTDCQLDSLPAELFELRDLEELSLAGNCLSHLPDAIGQLTGLKRLQLAGNQLTQLPASLGQLVKLEGLWLGGNLLEALPSELGNLCALRQLSVSGNCLASLPPSLGKLAQLEELEAAGNLLSSCPEELGSLGALKKLSLNGNRISALPDTLGTLTSLQELWLMGNCLQHLPASCCSLPALRQLSIADNRLTSLPPALGSLQRLEKLWAYGNSLQGRQALPCFAPPSSPDAPAAWAALDSVWLEGNPLGPEAAEQLLRWGQGLPKLRSLGVDLRQLVGVPGELVQAAGSSLKLGEVLGEGPGYFKLAPSPGPAAAASNGKPAAAAPGAGLRGPAVSKQAADAAAAAKAAAAAAAAAAAGAAAASAAACGAIAQQPVLVVSFGSAPGVPNWGGLLGRLYGAARDDSDSAFDVLYVVDPSRAWYDGGDGSTLAYYGERLRQYTQRYKHVVMVGDSMGATAALMFCEQATSVLAFCPQVDLAGASIRPGQPTLWLDQLRDHVVAAVAATAAEVTVLCGTWQHDIDQTKLLPASKVKVKVFSLDSHRLAVYLDTKDRLLPLVQDAIKHQLNLRTGNVRIANLF